MRLDATDLRYVTPDEFRALAATEIGSKNHEVVPTPVIADISGLRGGNVNKLCGELAKRNLIARVQNARYDGYRLTYGGLDYLALKTFSRRKPPSVASVGRKFGVGKESDIYVVQDEAEEKRVLKLHRLGRISFRAIKSKRDYLGKRTSASWMFMSRLSAEKEFAFLKVLYHHGFPVPIPMDQNRHCVVMSLIDCKPLRAVMQVPDAAELYGQLMELIMRFARSGLIHCDFNEFNILIPRKGGEPVVIDFPQMVSTRHQNAEFFFNRDVDSIRRFFRKRFRFEGTTWPVWADVMKQDKATEEAVKAFKAAKEAGDENLPEEPQHLRLDLEVEASGFNRGMQRQLEEYMNEVEEIPRSDAEEEEDDDEDDDEDEEEEDDEEEEEEEAEEEESNDPEAAAAAAAAKLERLRLHKALGNDGDPDQPLPEPEPEVYSEEEVSDSDADSDDSTGVAPSDYTQYIRGPRARPERMQLHKLALAGSKKLGAVDELKATVAAEMSRQKRQQGAGGVKSRVGRAKGHKWKSNAAYQATKTNTGWD